ncbi:MAG: hypothetical protein JEZ07_03400 [Phycisphaerae bacterium]|nr:hypothetical protein [Phycisphaerae bacterium]
MLSKKAIENGLVQFTGTEQYYKNEVLGPMVYTDGVKYLHESADCYWLLVTISSYRRTEPFQLWELKVQENRSAILTMKEDSGEPYLVNQKIPFTDFPLDEIKFYLIDGVLLLPSEY